MRSVTGILFRCALASGGFDADGIHEGVKFVNDSPVLLWYPGSQCAPSALRSSEPMVLNSRARLCRHLSHSWGFPPTHGIFLEY